jgi:hypothetical protein
MTDARAAGSRREAQASARRRPRWPTRCSLVGLFTGVNPTSVDVYGLIEKGDVFDRVPLLTLGTRDCRKLLRPVKSTLDSVVAAAERARKYRLQLPTFPLHAGLT